jgi:hypothetical protein
MCSLSFDFTAKDFVRQVGRESPTGKTSDMTIAQKLIGRDAQA